MTKRPAQAMPPARRSPEHFFVVSYDIPLDKRRDKVRKILEDFGERVQYSVFECRLRPKDYRRLRERLRAVVNRKEDDVRFFHLCETCLKKAAVWGQRQREARRESVIV